MTLAVHNMGHFSRQVKDFGPIRETWAFGAESKLGTMKRKAFNRYLPGACIMYRQVYEESLRIIARISSSQIRNGANIPLEMPGRIHPVGKSVQKESHKSRSTINDIIKYITSNWKEECSELLQDLAPGSNEYILQVLQRTSHELVSDYDGRKKSLVGVQPKTLQSYKKFRFNQVEFETFSNAQSKARTDNSNIVFKIPQEPERLLVGRIHSIIQAEVGNMPFICMYKKLFYEMGYQVSCISAVRGHDGSVCCSKAIQKSWAAPLFDSSFPGGRHESTTYLDTK